MLRSFKSTKIETTKDVKFVIDTIMGITHEYECFNIYLRSFKLNTILIS